MSFRGYPDSPLSGPISPKASTGYTPEQCQIDAQQGGLDAHALRLHVEATLDAQTGLRDDQLDRFLRAHRISRTEGLSKVDKARMFAGVPPEFVAPEHVSRSPAGREQQLSTSPPNVSLPSGSMLPPSVCSGALVVHPSTS